MSLMAVSDNSIVVSKGSFIDCYDYKTHTIFQVTAETSSKDEIITDVVLSHDGKLLAVLLPKRVMLYELPDFKNIQKFVLQRSASKIRFGGNTQLLAADKTGDVYCFDLNETSGSKLLGHLSLLLNLLQTNDGRYIITSDRDEKIRVTCYPNSYNIQTYCLGHKEFVNHIELIPHSNGYLTSASGDGTIKFWNYVNGKLLYSIDTFIDLKNSDYLKQEFRKLMDEDGIEINSLPIVGYTISSLNDVSSLIAVTVYSHMKVLIYQICIINEQISHNLVGSIPVNNFPTAIKFHNLSLFVYDSVDSEINEYKVDINNDNVIIDLFRNIKLFENMDVKLSEHDYSCIKQLFKRKFDNVQEYQERKKQRLEKAI